MSTKRIVFLHPDLGIGGAERLVIDAAVGLQDQGHRVTIFTSHCDPTHCFTEAKDGTLDVRVRGNTVFPPTIIGRFAIFCAIARQIHLILSIALFSSELSDLHPTHFFVDQLSAGVPLLRLLTASSTRILFYCHFPDKLLAKAGTGLLRTVKAVYRVPFDLLEGWSTCCSDEIVVNSKFTATTVSETLTSLQHRQLKVIYPCVDTGSSARRNKPGSPARNKTYFLSINRFEQKKGIDLAIRAYAGLSTEQKSSAVLLIAGGYDPRVDENVTYLKELEMLSAKYNLSCKTSKNLEKASQLDSSANVIFLPSISDTLKQSLLDAAALLLYTPNNEHFGIVPLEAMLNGVPVLAANQGGPLETVVDGETGWLRSTDRVEHWTEIMSLVTRLRREQPAKLVSMGAAGTSRVEKTFSKPHMASLIDEVMDEMVTQERPPWFGVEAQIAFAMVLGIGLVVACTIAMAFYMTSEQ